MNVHFVLLKSDHNLFSFKNSWGFSQARTQGGGGGVLHPQM